MRLEISTAQLRNLKNGKNINMSSAQLNGKNKAGSVKEIMIDDSNFKAMTLAKNKGKGYRVKPSDVVDVSGGNIFKSISKGVKKATKSVSKGVSKATESVGDAVVDVAESAYKGALKEDIGGKVEWAKKNIVPKSVAQEAIAVGITAVLVSGGTDPSDARKIADVMAATSATALYDLDFSKPITEDEAKKVGTKAVKAGAKEAIKGGAIKDNKGIHNYARDDVKQPMIRGGSVVVTNLVPKIAVDGGKISKSVGRKVNKIAKIQSESRFDPNIAFGAVTTGGSFKPIESRAGSFKPVSRAGSMKAIGSGSTASTKRPKLVKGSAESKAWGERMRNAREKKKK